MVSILIFYHSRNDPNSHWCSYTVTGPVLELIEEEYVTQADFIDCDTMDEADIIRKTEISFGNYYCYGNV